MGAAGGAALGGVEGAFAGAAIGAQLGGIRQALGATAQYAAEIGKLKIALEGVTESEQGAAASQANFAEALDAAAQSTRDYNVPQGAAIAGITRLTAAVTGAGGPVADAATTFQNVTAAIKATGGSTEDVRGAITAMVQVFSKGKVSAEELSGQLGERLPGAVTLFAKANKMTLPELQKNLKAGTVGLNELMTFIRALGEEFDGTAKDIAASNEEAGARLTVAFDNMKLSVGNALKDTGAEFQNIFGRFIQEITPKAVKAAESLAEALIPVAKNLDIVIGAVAGLAAGAVLGAAIKGIIALKAALVGTKTVIGALTAVMALNPIFAGALAVGGIVAGILAINKAINGQADALERVKRAGAAQGATGAEKAEAISTVKAQISEQERIIADNQGRTTGQGSQARTRRRQAAEKELARLKKQLADITRVRKKDKPEDSGFKYDPVTPDGDGGGDEDKSLARRISQAQKLEARQVARLNLAQAEGKISSLLAKQLNERTQLEARIAEIKKKGTTAEIDRATSAARTALETKQQVEQQKVLDALYKKALQPLRSAVKAVKEKVQFDNRYKELLKQGINPERAKAIISIEKAFNKTVEVLDVEIDILKAKVAQGDATKQQIALLDELIRKRKEAEGEKQEGVDATEGVGKQPTFMEGLDEAIDAQKKSLEELISPLNQVKELSNALGESFKSSFKGLIDGTMSGREALANFFQGVADHFANMAAEIAAEALKLAAMQFIKFIIGGFSNGGTFGSGSGTTPPTTLPGSVGAIAANGLAIGKNGIVPYAKGGIVNKPTLFQYASGGSGRFGLMGEAGPEAIMPLRRGRNGKLGVEAAGGGTTNVNVNVDASGSSVEGDSDQASQLGKMLGAAVQAELVKQKRPGGLLAS